MLSPSSYPLSRKKTKLPNKFCVAAEPTKCVGRATDSPLLPALASPAMRTLLVASVCFTSLLGALLGYDIGIVSGAIVFITKDLSLSAWQAEVVVGSLNLVSAFGALLAGSFADRFGRKAAICLANALFVGGTLTVVLSYGFSGLLAGRILMGFGVGCGFVVGPLYTASSRRPNGVACSPRSSRSPSARASSLGTLSPTCAGICPSTLAGA